MDGNWVGLGWVGNKGRKGMSQKGKGSAVFYPEGLGGKFPQKNFKFPPPPP